MANSGIYQKNLDVKTLLTLIVPGQCNLFCSFCIIRQRNEHSGVTLTPSDYVNCVEHFFSMDQNIAVSIQGYEPLLPVSYPYTQLILQSAKHLAIPAAFVTNGTFLETSVDWLKPLSPGKIVVSLDSADPSLHDRQRGVAGTFDAAVAGLRLATRALPHTEFAVSSVLLPGKTDRLRGIPALLASLNVREWMVNPLIRIGKDAAGGPTGRQSRIFSDALMLWDEARAQGIDFVLEDEFGCLDRSLHEEARSLPIRSFPRDLKVLRLTPNGRYSIGKDILKRLEPHAPRWLPQHAAQRVDVRSQDKLLASATGMPNLPSHELPAPQAA